MPLKIHYLLFYKINMLKMKQLFMRKCFFPIILSSERSQVYTFDQFT